MRADYQSRARMLGKMQGPYAYSPWELGPDGPMVYGRSGAYEVGIVPQGPLTPAGPAPVATEPMSYQATELPMGSTAATLVTRQAAIEPYGMTEREKQFTLGGWKIGLVMGAIGGVVLSYVWRKVF